MGGSGTFGTTLVDAQIVGYVNTTLRLAASAVASTSTAGSSASYNYGAYLLYNIGYGVVANIPLFPWYAATRDLYNPPKQVTLYSNAGVSSSSAKKRDVAVREIVKVPRRGLLNSKDDSELESDTDRTKSGSINSSSLYEPSLHNHENYSVPVDEFAFLNRRALNIANVPTGPPDLSLAKFFTCPSGAAQNILPDFRRKCTLCQSIENR